MGEQESQHGQSSNVAQTKKQSHKVARNNQRQDFSDEKWELIFDQLLEEDKIDVPADFYDEQILFTKPEEMIEIFESLEEHNLGKIKKCQEIELNLEQEKEREAAATL